MTHDEHAFEEGGEESSARHTPHRKSSGPGRERKQKARRTSTRKQGGTPAAGMHRRGSKRRNSQ